MREKEREIVMGFTLTVLIPLVVLAYAVWLVARMVRARRRGESTCGYGGCAGCPMAEGCQLAKKREAERPGANRPPEAGDQAAFGGRGQRNAAVGPRVAGDEKKGEEK